MNMKCFIMITLSAMMLFSGVADAKGTTYREYPVSATIVVTEDGGTNVSESIEIKKGEYFKVVLYAAGGTGYDWALGTQNPLLAEFVEKSTAPVAGAEKLAGGKVRWIFVLKMKDDASGQETLQFVLRRSWEKNVPPARTFDLTLVTR